MNFEFMRYVFFGTPQISAIILEKLIDSGIPPTILVCNPDRPTGRKQKLTPPPTKALIASRAPQVQILQPEDPKIISDKLKAVQPDFFIVAAYGKIIPKEILNIPRLGTIGIHFSLLPKYRGASPLQTAILNGETETGISLYLLNEKMDQGPILAQSKLRIANEFYPELAEKFANFAAEMLINLLPEFVAGRVTPIPQDHNQATYTRKFTAADAFVEPQDLEAAEAGNEEKGIIIFRKIRALNPEPGVWTERNGKRMKLLSAEVQNGKLVLKEIQFEGQKPQCIQ